MARGPGGFSVGRVSVKVVPDTDDFRSELLKDLKKIQKELRVEIPVDFDTKAAKAQLKSLQTQIEKLDKNVDINIDTNSGGLAAQLKSVAAQADNASQGFDKMSRAGMIGVAVMLLLAPALALIATLLAGLPSLILAFGAGIAAVALGAGGFGKAVKAFSPTIERLKASLSTKFEDSLTPVFKDLNKLAPVLDKGLVGVAEGISTIIAQLATVATSATGMKQIETILAGTTTFFLGLGPALAEGTKAFLLLASEGAKQLGTLSDVFFKFSAGFNTMVQSLVADGSFKSAISGIAQVFSSLLTTFTRLFDAGVRAMGQLSGPMVTFINGFADALIALMPALTELSGLVFTVLGEALAAIVPALKALTPAFTLLARLVGVILSGAIKVLEPLLTALAQILGDVVLKVLQALEPILPPLIKFFQELGQVIADRLLGAMTALTPLLDALLLFCQQLLLSVEPLLPAIVELIDTALKGLVDILIVLMPHLLDLVNEALPPLIESFKAAVPHIADMVTAFAEMIPMIVELVKFFVDVLGPALTDVVSLFSEGWKLIEDVVIGALKVITDTIRLFVALISGEWGDAWILIEDIAKNGLQLLIDAIELGLKAVVAIFVQLPLKIIGALAELGVKMFNAGKSAISSFADGIGAGSGNAVLKAGNAVAKIRGLFPSSPAKIGPFSGYGYTTYSGKALMEDWARGISDGTPAVIRAIDSAMQTTQGSMELQSSIATDGYGSIGDKVAEALTGWSVEIDGNGLAKIVNKANVRKARRG